ncbi:MAG: sodium/pantothenate symporter [Dorea sp.]|nr:sodium/pantothenate symporter [Dorea sp.]
MSDSVLRLIPVIVFFAGVMGVGIYVQRRSADAKAQNFSKEYFIGGRSLGGFVLAMTLVATYGSVSSFLSGAGKAWETGFGWVYYATSNVVAAFLILGVLGKKMAVIGRKTDSVTVIDVLRARYNSNGLSYICTVAILIFFTTQMVSQFIGGAQLFAACTGFDYTIGLLIFATVVVIYTTIGGFTAVAITDTACAIVMVIGTILLGIAVIQRGGGLEAIMESITAQSAQAVVTGEGIDLLDPRASGQIPFQLYLSQWLLCGFTTIGLPQSQVRCLGYRDTKSVHKAMIYGTVVVGIMMIGIHLIGIWSRGLFTAIDGSTDTVIPVVIVNYMLPILGGVAIIGPLAAAMSTVSSLLIAGSSAIVKDMYLHYKAEKKEEPNQKLVAKISFAVTAIMGILAVVIAVNPPDLIVWINMFAFGGLQTVFFWTMLFGLFWKTANKVGAIASVIGGLSSYCITMALNISIGSFHNIIIGLVVALVCFIIGNKFGAPIDDKTGKIFFPEMY